MASSLGPRGHLGFTHKESEPAYPPPITNERPNVVVVLFDDLGFADLGCYGSEIRTPRLDELAAAGHRYNNFHTTTLCSPSRACLLTGRNHHAVGMRMLSNVDSGWPSGRGRITRSAALMSEVLGSHGYNTSIVGKWHVAPMRDVSPAGPFDEWPLGRGFNRFYGFMNGAADHYYPELVQDNHWVRPPARPEDGYHLTTDLIDRAIGYVADHIANAPHNPFFLYVPLGASHAPHHAPDEAMEAVRGRYDAGWDRIRRERYERQLEMGVIPPGTDLPPSNPGVPAWDTLEDDEKRVAARLQEAYAAMVEHTDAELGRLFDFLRRTGELDDTIVIVTSDNGAAHEGGRLGAISRIRFFNDMEEDFDNVLGGLQDVGGPRADTHYATGWAQASNTPLKWYKYHTHGGGIRDPLIVHWTDRLARPGGVLDQFHHIVDLAPTVYEAVDLDPPDAHNGVPQMPIHGRSLAYTFDRPDAPTVKRVQYFEMFGNRGLWADGWKAVTRHFTGNDYDEDWELYHLDDDFSESTDLAEDHPEKLRELVDLWWQQAGLYDVLPLDDRSVELFRSPPPPGSPLLRDRFDYFPPVSHVEPSIGPPLGSAKRYRIEAHLVDVTPGVIVAYGNTASGFVLFVDDELALRYEYNAASDITAARLEIPPSGSDGVVVAVDFRASDDKSASFQLSAGTATGETTEIPRALSFLALAGMDIGHNPLSPVSSSFSAPYPYRGTIDRLTVTVERDTDAAPPPLDD